VIEQPKFFEKSHTSIERNPARLSASGRFALLATCRADPDNRLGGRRRYRKRTSRERCPLIHAD
jgi:hypothetical protein